MQHIHHISQAKGMDLLRLDLCKDDHMKMIHLKSSFSEKKCCLFEGINSMN